MVKYTKSVCFYYIDITESIFFRYDPKSSYKKAYLEEKSKLEDADDDDCIESEEKEKDD